MKNNSEELNILVEQARMFLDAKVEKLSNSNSINNEVQQKIIELEKRIEALEEYTDEIEELYSSNPNMLLNFRKRTNDIKVDIGLIM
jgi:hypothetical protein